MWEKNHVCTFICRIALLSQNSTMYSLNLVVNFGSKIQALVIGFCYYDDRLQQV